MRELMEHAASQHAGNSIIGIYFRRDNRISIYRGVIRMLGNPDYINFWWGARDRVLLVSTATEPNDNSVCIADSYKNVKQGLRFQNIKLLSAITMLVNKKDIRTYRLRGEYIPELNMVAFWTNTLQ